MPPLRSRLDSLQELATHFVVRASNRLNKPVLQIDDQASLAMMRYPWPGNIRELQNVIERAAVLSRDRYIRLENLPVIFAELAMHEEGPWPEAENCFRNQREKHVGAVEKNLLKRYLQETGGNVSAAARLARIPRRTFYRLLARYELKGSDFQSG
jgi:DNA-binding NtrC family response regulator